MKPLHVYALYFPQKTAIPLESCTITHKTTHILARETQNNANLTSPTTLNPPRSNKKHGQE